MLTPKQRQTLKALAHHIQPIVQIGKNALSDSVVAEVDSALLAHELIKVKLNQGVGDEENTLITDLCEKTEAILVDQIGRIVILYRRHPKKPTIRL